MTITNTDTRNGYTATAGQTEFVYTFDTILLSDVVVYLNGTKQTANSNYTIANNTITFLKPLAANDEVAIIRETPKTQEADYRKGAYLSASAHARAYDKLTMIAQENRAVMSDRVLTLPDASHLTDIEFPVLAGKGVKWNASGTALETTVLNPGDTANVITAKGDMARGGEAGETAKLAIGYRGKLLRATDESLPEWIAEREIDTQTDAIVILGNNGAGRVFLCDTSNNAITLSIPAPTSDNIGSVWTFKKTSNDYNKVTIQCFDGVTTINGELTYTLYEENDYVSIVLNTTNMSIIAKDSRPQVLTTSGVITQGDFEGMVQAANVQGESPWDTGSGWSISGSGLTHNGDGAYSKTTQTNVFTSGETYEITYTVSGRTVGSVTVFAGLQAGTERKSNGTFEEQITADGTYIKFEPDGGFNGTISNVTARLRSTKLVIPADDTDPTSSEGASVLCIKHRARAVGNRITINAVVYISTSNASNEVAAVLHNHRTTDAWAAASGIWKPNSTQQFGVITLNYTTLAITTDETVYRVRIGGNDAARTTYIDRWYTDDRRHALTPKTHMVLTESAY